MQRFSLDSANPYQQKTVTYNAKERRKSDSKILTMYSECDEIQLIIDMLYQYYNQSNNKTQNTPIVQILKQFININSHLASENEILSNKLSESKNLIDKLTNKNDIEIELANETKRLIEHMKENRLLIDQLKENKVLFKSILELSKDNHEADLTQIIVLLIDIKNMMQNLESNKVFQELINENKILKDQVQSIQKAYISMF